MTHQIMGEVAQTMSEAWSFWDRPIPAWLFLPEPDRMEKEFRSRSRLSTRSPKVWAEAHLLAFAAVSGLKVVRFGACAQVARCGCACSPKLSNFSPLSNCSVYKGACFLGYACPVELCSPAVQDVVVDTQTIPIAGAMTASLIRNQSTLQ